MPFFPEIYTSIDIGYNYVPLRTDVTTLSLMTLGAGVGFNFNPIPTISIRTFATGGYFYGFLHNGDDSGGNPYVGGGLGTYILFSPRLGAGVDAGYRQYLGFGSEIFVTAGVIFNIVPSKKGGAAEGLMEHKPGEGLDLLKVNLNSVFPVFFSYYDNNPIGTGVIKNFEKKAIENIEITYYVKQYMDNPKKCNAPASLAPGEEAEIDLYSLFTNRILEVSEGTKVSALINIKYSYNNGSYYREKIVTQEIQNRNAITWDDDRRVAAFVTAKDTAILKFAKNTAGIVKDNAGDGVNRNLVLAMGINAALREHGISYVIDPATPYSELAGDKGAVDFIQFPMQTLDYKAGDCDDLSILNCALLEAVGVETAFVTIPGHIFMAFCLDITEKEAEKQFLRPEDLIYMENKVWIPVEITETEGGFLKAWQIGAKQWRENASKLKAGFYPTRTAWEQYNPVGFDIAQVDITMPDPQKVAAAFRKEYDTFIERELYPQVEELNLKIEKSQRLQDINKLGVLYARYGMNDKAEEQFKKVIDRSPFFPSLMNLGNINYLSEDYAEALAYYNQADKIKPNSKKVLLGIARTSHQAEDYDTAATAFSQLKKLDPELAENYSYLDMRSKDATRASDQAQVTGNVLWEDEE
ncbi:tetratricopeptide repeat protein [Oceanispirochaeta sp.]|uniref:tetratricopeptide repeat protein n=1 Tax=Oceanispirochaeta sp. TaxID=2035350 RepID=UPI00262FDD7F|nr:tetratricopeptide repeat protein [Oceanispirochaeta sp.]MDA3958198.1 hypothetical protein [Oceanispirochaeta sp.]